MRSLQFGLLAFVILVAGCQTQVDVIDLNKVLDILQATLTELDGDDKDAVKGEEIKPVDKEEEEKRKQFLDAYAKNLTAAKLVSTPIGVEMHDSGSIHGFADKDGDNVKDTGEKELFKVDIDEKEQRLVATDNANHYRDHHYRGRSHGLFTGYMFGRMMSRGNSYYSGTRASMRPDYSKTTMSPKTYHKSAVAKARSAARATARARSGSRGSSFGK